MDIFIINNKNLNHVPPEILNDFGQKLFKNREKELIHQFSYLMIDRILKEVYKIENRSLVTKENGKPELENQDKYLSISHSGEYIVLGFSDSKCGVDIEKIKPRNYKKISEKMGFKSSSLEEFYLNWTKYEAEYKLDGESKSTYKFSIPNYIITAVNENENEIFDTYYSN